MVKYHFFLVFAAMILAINALVEINDFFPFGVANGDQYLEKGDDISSANQNLSITFPFFGYNHSSLWVNINGAISFNSRIAIYTSICAPLQHDYRMVSPFWADVDTRFDDPTPESAISYRESTTSLDLQKAKDEVVHAFPDFSDINLTWAYVVTWHNVTFFKGEPSRTIRNTFQAAITTDGRHSFAIFYYNKIQWTTEMHSGEYNDNGTGSTHAQVGFDAGDSQNRLMLDVSCTDSVINITAMSNVEKPGVFVFRIDSAEIIKPPTLSPVLFATQPTPAPLLQMSYNQIQSVKCPSNSIQLRINESVCYSFHPSLSQFVIAERECNLFGANLVSLKNKYTSVYVPQLANLLFKHLEVEQFWSNAHRLINENTFKWTDGEDFKFTNWKNNETEQGLTSDCVAVNLEKGYWQAEDCFSRLPFVCEFNAAERDIQVPPTALNLEEFQDLSNHLVYNHQQMDGSFADQPMSN